MVAESTSLLLCWLMLILQFENFFCTSGSCRPLESYLRFIRRSRQSPVSRRGSTLAEILNVPRYRLVSLKFLPFCSAKPCVLHVTYVFRAEILLVFSPSVRRQRCPRRKMISKPPSEISTKFSPKRLCRLQSIMAELTIVYSVSDFVSRLF